MLGRAHDALQEGAAGRAAGHAARRVEEREHQLAQLGPGLARIV